jgi:hypothetical protein
MYYSDEEPPKSSRRNDTSANKQRQSATYYSDEKPPQKNENTGYLTRERGGCLTVFLVAAIVFSGFSCLYTIQLSDTANKIFEIPYPALVAASTLRAAEFVCVIGLWYWQKWAINGMLIVYAIMLVISLLSRNFVLAIITIVEAGILYALINERLEMFE